MVAIDTNILVRLLTKDDESQYQCAYALFQRKELYLCKTVILETEWVLRYAYKFQPSEIIIRAYRMLFGLPNIYVEDAVALALALEWHESGLDFADALHLATCQQCEEFYTFDERFVKKGNDVSSCPVRMP